MLSLRWSNSCLFACAGSYVCKAHNDAGTVASNPAVVSMYPSPPVIRMTVPSSAVRYGAAFVMGVEVEGSPRPRLQWCVDMHRDVHLQTVFSRCDVVFSCGVCAFVQAAESD
jgi:hypothetical protein